MSQAMDEQNLFDLYSADVYSADEAPPESRSLPHGCGPRLAPPFPSLDLSRRVFLQVSAVAGLVAAAGCQNQSGGYPDPVDPGAGNAGSAGTPAPPRPYGQPTPPPRVTTPYPTQPLPGGGGGGIAPTTAQGVIRRSNWTRAGVARPNEIFQLRTVTRITIHHEGVTPFTTTSEDATRQRLEIIRRGHVTVRGWADIGYHYLIDPAGRIWEGRSVQYQGAHVKDQNEGNLGVMVIGNFEKQTPNAAQTSTLTRFVASQMRQYRVPVSRVFTHRELAPTECPGRSLQQYLVMARASGGPLRVALAQAGAPELATA